MVKQWPIVVAGARGVMLEAGRGPDVVLLSSPLVLARSYLPTVHALAPRFRVRVVGFPGSGRGSKLSPAWSFDQFTRWTAAMFDSLDLERATVIGHSNSAPIAMGVSLQNARVERLILVGSIGAHSSPSLPRVLMARGIDCLHEPILTLRAWNHVLLNAVYHARNFFNQVRLSAGANLTPLAPRIEVPTLLAWGRLDHTTPLSGARRFHSLLPDSRLHIFPHGSHDWLITHPDDFARVVRQFTTNWSEKTD